MSVGPQIVLFSYLSVGVISIILLECWYEEEVCCPEPQGLLCCRLPHAPQDLELPLCHGLYSHGFH